MLHRNGFGVLLIDQRDHGDSTTRTSGSRAERGIPGRARGVGLARCPGRPGDRIGILGMSFGAATTVIAGGEEPRVQAVWEDSAFGDISVAMQEYLVASGYPAFLEPGAGDHGAGHVGRRPDREEPAGRDPRLRGPVARDRPGAADTTILVAHAERLYAAAQSNGVNVGDLLDRPGRGVTRVQSSTSASSMSPGSSRFYRRPWRMTCILVRMSDLGIVEVVEALLPDRDAVEAMTWAERQHLLGELTRSARMIEAATLDVVDIVDRSGEHRADGHLTARAWLAAVTNEAQVTCSRRVRIARALRTFAQLRSMFRPGACRSGTSTRSGRRGRTHESVTTCLRRRPTRLPDRRQPRRVRVVRA